MTRLRRYSLPGRQLEGIFGLILAVAVAAFSLGLSGCKSKAPVQDDASLTTAIRARLSSEAALKSESIDSSVQNGVATLNGTVSSDAARALAANDAAQVDGIRTVVNNLSVAGPVATEVAPPVTAAPAPASPAPVSMPRVPGVKKPLAASPKVQRSSNDAAGSMPAMNSAPIEREAAPPPPSPPPPPAPAFRTLTIPSGSSLPVRITQTLDSATTQTGDSFTGTIATDVIVDGLVALPQGTAVTGRVDTVQEAAHFKGNSLLTIELTNITRKGEHIPVTTDPFSKAGTGRGKNTAEKVGGGAAVGAILGGIFGGGKGAVIGAAAGGGAGAGAQAITRGQQVQIPSETLVRFRLTNALAVRVSTANAAPGDSNAVRRPLEDQSR